MAAPLRGAVWADELRVDGVFQSRLAQAQKPRVDRGARARHQVVAEVLGRLEQNGQAMEGECRAAAAAGTPQGTWPAGGDKLESQARADGAAGELEDGTWSVTTSQELVARAEGLFERRRQWGRGGACDAPLAAARAEARRGAGTVETGRPGAADHAVERFDKLATLTSGEPGGKGESEASGQAHRLAS